VMSFASSAVTYTSVYTDSEPGRAFWGADEEISDGGSLRVIVYGYDGLPMQPAHDPDYVPEPMYPEYIPLEDEHVFLTEEQPLPPVDSLTAKTPGYFAESDPRRNQRIYEIMRTEDGPNEDEEDEEEEEEHPAPADSIVVVPTVEHVSPPKGTEPVIPPPSTDITTTRADAQVPSFSFHTTFQPEGGVTVALPSPPLPPLPPSLYIPPPVDRRDDVPESELPPRKRLCLSTLGSRYEIRESSTARILGESRDTWVDPAEAVPKIAPMTVGEVNTRVTELAELHEHDTQDLYALLEDAQDGRTRISQRVAMDSQRVDLLMGDMMTLQETVWIVEEEAYASREAWAHSIGLSQATYQELQNHRDHVYAHESHIQAHQAQLQLQSTLIQTQHQASGTDGRSRQPVPDARIPDHQDASGDADSHI
ncbi:hypothetical protein Tco_1387195, partial [Tanacetum coccineum]